MDFTLAVGLGGGVRAAMPRNSMAGEAPRADASLCMTCRVRDLCVGGVAADAGTTQLRCLLAGRRRLGRGDTLVRQGDPFQFLFVVRSGFLKSSVARPDGQRVLGFHLPGDLLGADGLGGQRHVATLEALGDAELCVLRHGGPGTGAPGVRAFSARLWDMMSRGLLRERSHEASCAGLQDGQRVTVFLAGLCARLRAHGIAVHGLPLPLSGADLASYLGVAEPTVGQVLRSLAGRGLLQLDGPCLRIAQPEPLQEAAKAMFHRIAQGTGCPGSPPARG